MSENRRIRKATGTIGVVTLVSRILGFIRDMTIAGLFGAGVMADVFIAAFRIPNLLKRMFGEGALSVSIIPVFTEYLGRGDKSQTIRLFRSLFWFCSVMLIMLTLLGMVAAPWIARSLAHGFDQIPGKMNLTVALMRFMMPYVFFIGMTALCMGILNALGRFAAPAMAPVFLNLSMILSVLCVSGFSENPETRVYALAAGVVAGGIIQLAVQIPFLIKEGMKWRIRPDFYHPGLKKIGIMFVPAIIGASVFQINTLVGNLLASFGPDGSVTHLYLADRLVQFPLGVFGLAMANAVLPSFSRQFTQNDWGGMKETFQYAINLVLFIIIPAMAGLIVLREPIIEILFQRGLFSHESTRLTAHALLYYTIGLWAFASVRIVVSLFHAIQDTGTPLIMAIISIFANIILGIIFLKTMGYVGVALALSLSSILNLALLTHALRARMGPLGMKTILQSAGKNAVSSVLMGLIVWYLYHTVPWNGGSDDWEILRLFGSMMAGVICYGVCSILFQSREMKSTLVFIQRRIRTR